MSKPTASRTPTTTAVPLGPSALAALTAALRIALLSALLVTGTALAEGGAWELRVCADPNSLPFSARDGTGFENRVAEILADELGATLTYDWYPLGQDMIDLRLREGECDLIMGVPDGYRGLLTTVAYYRSPYVFVYRADAPFELESFDDPVLADLRIGLQNVGIPPHEALVNRGLQGNVVRLYGEHQFTDGAAYVGRLIEDVASGEVDVGIAWGPGAGYFARQHGAELVVEPVQPQIEPPFLPMTFAMTMAMRQGDESLRDRLDLALAARWDEIQALLEEYGVPLDPLPSPPRARGAGSQDAPLGALRLGLVVPTLTGTSITRAGIYEPGGEAARRGALLAEGEVAAEADSEGLDFRVSIASAPTPEAAVRAAERLVATEGVSAIVGGVGRGQAAALARVASERRVPFVNLTDPSQELRAECSPYVFHLAPSAAIYLDAMADWYGAADFERWFVVHEDTPEGAALAERAAAAVAGRVPGAAVVGTAAVSHEQPAYVAEIEAAREAGADLIVLLLDAPDQIAFLGQLESLGAEIDAAPFPDPVTQLREYISAASFRTGGAGVTYRLAPWEATLEAHGADELNARFASRWGDPMDPPAWAAYETVRLLYGAARQAGSTDPEALAAQLASGEPGFDLHKGPALAFRAGDHQLLQPLYAVRVDPDAPWGVTAGQRTAVASLAGVLPRGIDGVDPTEGDAARELLEGLGDPVDERVCE